MSTPPNTTSNTTSSTSSGTQSGTTSLTGKASTGPRAVMPAYRFFSELATTLNSGQSKSVLLCGAVNDLFYSKSAKVSAGGNRAGVKEAGSFVPLVPFLSDRCSVDGFIVLVYEQNGPIRVHNPKDIDSIRTAWVAWQSGTDTELLTLQALTNIRKQRGREALEAEFDRNIHDAIGQPTVALEFLRQLTLMSRSSGPNGREYLSEHLVIIIEAADMLVPAGSGDISQLSPADRHRVAILQDWFSEPGFMTGNDSVVLIAESAGLLHPRITKLPSVLSIEVPAPDAIARQQYIEWFLDTQGQGANGQTLAHAKPSPKLWSTPADLGLVTASLSIHALRQILVAAAHTGDVLTPARVVGKVEQYIAAQLGEDVVEFKKPEHSLNDVVGFTKLKVFLHAELIPRFKSTGLDALPGAAVAGPIGGGKTFIFEAVAAALDLPVLVLKNIRSQWYGQTDVIFERLRRTLEALGKVVIFVDEADTQFGGVGADAHETERRLTGKVQQMMSDPRLRGKVIWLLMTARIHRLSADIRRPGRVGDLIIPVLDPEGEDRDAFLDWTLKGLLKSALTVEDRVLLGSLTSDYSAASYAALRSNLKANATRGELTLEGIGAIIRDQIQPAIGPTRRYQTLQALVNCTRRSLLPDPNITDEAREAWQHEIRLLEARGIS